MRIGGSGHATPLFLCLAAIVFADIAFAIDSIPAAFGITRDPFLIWMGNVFALLGLRALFVLVEGLIKRFRYLDETIAIVLAVVAVKLLLEDSTRCRPRPASRSCWACWPAGSSRPVAERRERPGGAERRRREARLTPVRTRSFGTTDLRCSEIGFGTWALGSNWWGNVTQRRGREPDPPRARPRHHLLRHRRRLREGRERGDRRPARLRRAARDRSRSRPSSATRSRSGRQEHSQGERPQDWSPEHARKSLEAQPAPPRHRLRRPLPAAQPAHGRDRARRPVRGARAPARRGQAAPLRRRARPGDRLARRGPARARGARHHVASRRSTTCSSRSRAATSSRRPSATASA